MLISFLISFLGSLLALGLIVLVGFVASRIEIYTDRINEMRSEMTGLEITSKVTSKALEVTSSDLEAADADIRIRCVRMEAAIAALRE